jgi:predicted DNA-binding transcriptional regulator YafY
MRASRLLTILMELQARGLVTAGALAAATEVSVRTIYRDIDALSAAGVPVYAEHGSAGGFRLLDGWRTRLNGLTGPEAEALFLSGLAGPAVALGMQGAMAAAQLKLAVALPPELREAAERMRTRFHLDAPGWFHAAEAPAHLQRLARAVWDQQMVEMRYRSWKQETRRRVAPLGIVLKSGAWYLVGAVGDQARTYRVERIRELAVLAEGFQRPAAFDLEEHWRASTRRLEQEMYANRAVIRLSPDGVRMLRPLLSPFVVAAAQVGAPDAEGYCVVTLPVGSIRQASADLLRFGADAEVLEPAELRSHLAAVTAALSRRYGA